MARAIVREGSDILRKGWIPNLRKRRRKSESPKQSRVESPDIAGFRPKSRRVACTLNRETDSNRTE